MSYLEAQLEFNHPKDTFWADGGGDAEEEPNMKDHLGQGDVYDKMYKATDRMMSFVYRCVKETPAGKSMTYSMESHAFEGVDYEDDGDKFPTELFDETGKTIRDLGHEYGAVTGRERRCGWVDLVALRYAIMVNGVTQLILMKSDVLDGFDTIKACVAYKVNGEEIDYFPYDITEGVEPVYAELPGWKTDMTKMTSEDEFPEEFNAYITFLEEQLGTPIKIVSVGPDRAQTIERYID
jgi:hypothetical protein